MMGENTKIEWAHHTFNPWLGCTKVSPACDHCYAEAWAKRTGKPDLWKGVRQLTSKTNWQQPRKWNFEAFALKTRYRVFCASLADVFDAEVSIDWRNMLFELIAETPHLDWLLLTKRPHIAKLYMVSPFVNRLFKELPPPNIWLGTTVENQTMADMRIPLLLETSAAKRFLSIEPLLGPIDLYNGDPDPRLGGHQATKTYLGDWWEPGDDPKGPPRHGIDWVIVGGESGPGARPIHPDWVRSLQDQCAAAEVPFFFKQWGEWAPGECILCPPVRTELTASWCNGRWLFDKLTPSQSAETHRDEEPDLYRVGKKAAGRLLDGRTWDEVPA